MTREDIVGALFTVLCGSSAFATTGRKLLHWSKVSEQPALFLRHVNEHYPARPTGMPAKITLDCEAFLYSNAGANPDVAPSIALNALLDALEATLKPPLGFQAQTLGGRVQHCWIEGEVKLEPGDLGGQAIAIVPIKILVPSFGR